MGCAPSAPTRATHSSPHEAKRMRAELHRDSEQMLVPQHTRITLRSIRATLATLWSQVRSRRDWGYQDETSNMLPERLRAFDQIRSSAVIFVSDPYCFEYMQKQ